MSCNSHTKCAAGEGQPSPAGGHHDAAAGVREGWCITAPLCGEGGGCLAAARHSVLLAEDNPTLLEEQMEVIMTQLLAYVKVGALLRVHVWVLT